MMALPLSTWIDHYPAPRFDITLRNFYSLTLRTVAERIAASEGRSLPDFLQAHPNPIHNLFGQEYLGSARSYNIWLNPLPLLAGLKEDFQVIKGNFSNPPVFNLHLPRQLAHLGEDAYFNDQPPVDIDNAHGVRVLRNGVFHYIINPDPDEVPEDQLHNRLIRVVPEVASESCFDWGCWDVICCSTPPVAELTKTQIKQLINQLHGMVMRYGAAPGMPIAAPQTVAGNNPVLSRPTELRTSARVYPEGFDEVKLTGL